MEDHKIKNFAQDLRVVLLVRIDRNNNIINRISGWGEDLSREKESEKKIHHEKETSSSKKQI